VENCTSVAAPSSAPETARYVDALWAAIAAILPIWTPPEPLDAISPVVVIFLLT